MDLSIIIVNYKTPQLILDCLASVYRETNQHSFEIIIVDNHSEDNSKEIITGKFPGVKWIQLDKNSGFATGNNEGIKKAEGDFILLLNSDTIILEGAIDKCISFLKSQTDSSVAVLGCKLLNSDRSLQHSSFPKRIWPGLKTTVLQNILLGKIRSSVFGKIDTPLDNGSLHGTIHFADAIGGSFILFDRKILSSAGLLDSDFFMYFEEIEWANRITSAGYKIIYYNKANIIHLHGASSPNMQVKKQSIFSQGLFILKVYGKAGYLFYLFMNYLNIISGYILYPLLSSDSKQNFRNRVKLFEPMSRHHLETLFYYGKRTSSGKKPLKAS